MGLLPYLGIACLLACSAFFSASETAFTSVNALRLKKSAEAGDKRAQSARGVLERYDSALSTILIGNNLVNIAASSLATLIAMRLFGDGAIGFAGVIMTLLILTFGEISPKILAKQRADSFVRIAAAPLRVMMTVFTPAITLVVKLVEKLSALWKRAGENQPTITEEEFAAILDTVEDEGVIDEDTSELLQSALEFDDMTAQQALTPRVNMVAADADDPPEEILKTVLDSQYSRIPVYRDTIDNIIGILPVNHYLMAMAREGACDIEKMLTEPLYIHMTMKLDDVLHLMRRKRNHIAVVSDEYGGTLGLLTMEDVLEQLVGEIWDESDDIVEECVKTGENTWEISGMMNLLDFFDELDLNERDLDSEYTTVGGWAVEMLDAQPEEGKSFVYGRLTVTVLKMDGMRVERVRARLEEEKAENPDDE